MPILGIFAFFYFAKSWKNIKFYLKKYWIIDCIETITGRKIEKLSDITIPEEIPKSKIERNNLDYDNEVIEEDVKNRRRSLEEINRSLKKKLRVKEKNDILFSWNNESGKKEDFDEIIREFNKRKNDVSDKRKNDVSDKKDNYKNDKNLPEFMRGTKSKSIWDDYESVIDKFDK